MASPHLKLIASPAVKTPLEVERTYKLFLLKNLKASARLQQGVLLLLFYSLGMGLPFLLLGLGLDQVSRFLKWLKPHLGKIEVGTGVVMILLGIMIYFNWLVYLNRYVTPFIRL